MEPLVLSFGPISEKNLGQFKKINESTLEVGYSEKFYLAITSQWQEFTFLGYLSDVAIGSISARREQRNEETCIYVMTCSVLKPYRLLKVGRILMEHLMEKVRSSGLKTLFLHVWTASVDAFKFYQALGFELEEEIPDYYQDLTPQSALVLKKTLTN
jgi:ribosomal protein S18 acetylase RimI-like enzyme